MHRTQTAALFGERRQYAEAVRIAENEGRRIANLKDFLAIIRNRFNYEQLIGDWYWLGDPPGLLLSGTCRVSRDGGITTVSEKQWHRLSSMERAIAYRGYDARSFGFGPESLFISGYARGFADTCKMVLIKDIYDDPSGTHKILKFKSAVRKDKP